MVSSQDTQPTTTTAKTTVTAMATRQSEPVYQRMEQEQHATPSSGCCAFVQHWIVAALLPCLPIAQVVSRGHRVGFVCMFATVFVLYAGGIACFFASSRIEDPVLTHGRSRVDEVMVLASGWATYILGPFVTIAFDFYIWVGWELHYGLSEEEPEDDYKAGPTAIALLVLHLISQCLFTVVIITLTLKIRATASCMRSCGWCCLGVCCPSCALGSAIAFATQKQIRETDEIPAYEV